MIDITIARESLPEKARESFDDIVYQRVLGASRHINMIGEMIESIAIEGKSTKQSVTKIVDDILTVTQFFIETRGEASQAISNAINIMVKGIDNVRELELEAAVSSIIQVKNSYITGAHEALDQVVRYGVKIAESMKTILVFDYSSTVDKFLSQIKPAEGELTVIIPESRSINGGYAFVKTCQDAGHKVKFIPDVAIMYYLKECDGAFMGVETFFPDGTMFNTTGSDIVGLVCKEYNVPLYALTPLIKVDVRPVYGYKKVLVKNDLKDRLATKWSHDEKEHADFICPELLAVDPKYVTAFVTEQGIIPTGQLFSVSTDYYKDLKGGL